jgi:hypothetical protein
VPFDQVEYGIVDLVFRDSEEPTFHAEQVRALRVGGVTDLNALPRDARFAKQYQAQKPVSTTAALHDGQAAPNPDRTHPRRFCRLPTSRRRFGKLAPTDDCHQRIGAAIWPTARDGIASPIWRNRT